MEKQEFRTKVLASYGANISQIEELLTYNRNLFDRDKLQLPQTFPLPPEAHVTIWEEYIARAQEIGTYEVLKDVLVQWQFPIQEGISQSQTYRRATLKGIECERMTGGLVLQQPEKLHLTIHQSLAGAIPVLLVKNRADFVAIVQAIAQRNEPVPIPPSMGACTIANYNNWDRIRRYRQQWEANNPNCDRELDWLVEFRRLIFQKHLYQDQFIILSEGFYSNIPPWEIGLSEAEWLRLSRTIRLEHECTHYFTHRLLKSMRNNLLDELIADYRGIVAAIGCYRADWFLRFMGLESYPAYREDGRLQNYRGQPPLSEGAFQILQALVRDAAYNLEYFARNYANELKTLDDRPLILIGLTYLTLEELAAPDGCDRLYVYESNTISEKSHERHFN